MRDIDTIDFELRLVAALRRAARHRGAPLPAIDVADALLDERREPTEWISEPVPAAWAMTVGPMDRDASHTSSRVDNSADYE